MTDAEAVDRLRHFWHRYGAGWGPESEAMVHIIKRLGSCVCRKGRQRSWKYCPMCGGASVKPKEEA